MTLLQGVPSIPGKSLIGSSLPTNILIKRSLSPSTPILSPGLNRKIFFRVNKPIYRELVREFFASFEFEASAYRYDPEHLGVKFRLGDEQREMSLLELGWRIGLYSERKSRENATLSGLSRAETVKATRLLMKFWPSIEDGGFNVGNMNVASIWNPRVKLAHRCIVTTISGRKENTNRVTKIDLYYLYCIYMEGVV
ncbi:hypothetical protein Tco_1030751 [Tanacetum coccineum]|uniref:Uncharacterized protein n=1 Tax=Tanacetum coccineum TaxID=301880 RepID=A0ABQ5G739_9ASTR